MSSDLPLVTIGLPTYNGAASIRRTLDALVNQDYPHIEILISDDASADETPSICEEYAAKYQFVTTSRNEYNTGSYYNFLKLLKLSMGKYYVWASQEYVWEPDFISSLVEVMEANPDCVASVCATRHVWEDTREEVSTVRLVGEDCPQANGYLHNAVSLITKKGKHGLIKNSIFMMGLLRREQFLSAVMSYPGVFVNERLILCQLALAGRLIFVDRVLFTRRARRRRRAEAYPEDPYMKEKMANSAFAKVAWKLAVSILRSRIVPIHRKLYVPVIVLEYWKSRVVTPAVLRVAGWVRPYLPRPVYLALKRLKGDSVRAPR